MPMCRVIVSDTSDAVAARKELDAQFAASKSWARDDAQSYIKDGLVRQAYVLGKGRPGPRLLTFIDGPAQVSNGGKGIQAMITVGVTKAGAAPTAEKK